MKQRNENRKASEKYVVLNVCTIKVYREVNYLTNLKLTHIQEKVQ